MHVETFWTMIDYTPATSLRAQAKLQYCDEATLCDAENEWSDVSGSTVQTDSGSTAWERQRTASAITLTSGRRYRVVTSSTGANEQDVASAKLIIEQNAVGGLTKMEMVHQYVNSGTSETATSLTPKDFDNEYDDDNYGAGTFTYYFEATMYCSTGCTATADLYDGASPITNSNITTTNETATRVRSGSALSGMPTSATDLDTRLQATSGDTTYANTSWLIIQVSSLQIPENLWLLIPFALFIPKILAGNRLNLNFSRINPIIDLKRRQRHRFKSIPINKREAL
jgi:hypothetical protein